MSYILEALKKAQAERQLGSAPDIHAPAPGHVPAPTGSASRKPLLIGLSAGIAIAGIAGVLAWRAQAPAAAPAVLAAQAPAPGRDAALGAPDPVPAAASNAAPAAAHAAVPVPSSTAATPVQQPVAVAAAPAGGLPAPAALPRQASPAVPETPVAVQPPVAEPAPVAPARKPVQPERMAAQPTPAQQPAAAADSGEAIYLPAPALARAPDPAPAVRAPVAAEETLRTLQQLPEALQREVPRVSVGGYIYSPNPADRLLLVDKVLRREGEELAPGLVLERLMPKHAVMNYRGTRYRVAY